MSRRRGRRKSRVSRSPLRVVRRAWTLLDETSVGLPRTSLVKKTETPFEIAKTIPALPGALEMAPIPIATADLTGPTPKDLLERAAQLGPRPTYESIVLPNDPVLHAKLEPRVAERRARFRRVVKGMLAGCIGVCVVALVVTAVSGGETPAASAATTAPSVATQASTPVEKLDSAKHGKAERAVPAAPEARVAFTRRSGKRH